MVSLLTTLKNLSYRSSYQELHTQSKNQNFNMNVLKVHDKNLK